MQMTGAGKADCDGSLATPTPPSASPRCSNPGLVDVRSKLVIHFNVCVRPGFSLLVDDLAESAPTSLSGLRTGWLGWLGRLMQVAVHLPAVPRPSMPSLVMQWE